MQGREAGDKKAGANSQTCTRFFID